MDIKIWYDANGGENAASNNVGGGFGTKTAWFSTSIDSINNILNRELPSTARITSARLYLNADYDLAGVGNVYIQYGFGGTNSISKTMLESNHRMSASPLDYPVTGIDAFSYFDSKVYPFAITKSYGSYLSATIWSSNIGNKTFFIKHARLDVSYTNYYTITINSNDASRGTVSGGGTYKEGDTAKLVATPNTGYYVAYWQKNGTKVDGTEKINSYNATANGNNKYTAVFEPISYAITYNLNGGTVDVANPTTYNITTSSFTLNNPSKSGADFTGWTGSNGSTPQESITITQGSTGDKNYTANYQEWTYNISMHGNGADGGSTSGYTGINWNSGIFLQKNGFTRTGYSFIGWNTAPDGSGISGGDEQAVGALMLGASQDGETINLYAQWSPNSYIIHFDANGGIGSMSDLSMVYGTSKNLTANTFTKAGHTFTGWNTAANGSGTHYNDGASVVNLATSGTKTLYAQWVINQYTITWKDWDGSELEKKKWNYDTIPSYSGDTDSLSYETEDAFHDFDGWTPDIQKVTADAIYTATYLTTTKTYTVIWKNADGQELERDDNVPHGSEPKYDGNVPTLQSDDPKYYYVFNNWDAALKPVTNNITYTATYTKNIYKYTVIWNDWDGTELEKDVDVVYDTPPSYDKENPVRESTPQTEYIFIGWKTEINETPIEEDDLSAVRGDITYTAVYEARDRMYDFSVVISPSEECGYVTGYTDSAYKYGSELTLAAVPYDGYQFVSWYYTVNGIPQTLKNNQLELSIFEDTEITAIFEEKPNTPLYINETQVDSVYVNPDTLTITYVVADNKIILPNIEDSFVSVDGWSFTVSNDIPGDGHKVESIYIDEVQIY